MDVDFDTSHPIETNSVKWGVNWMRLQSTGKTVSRVTLCSIFNLILVSFGIIICRIAVYVWMAE